MVGAVISGDDLQAVQAAMETAAQAVAILPPDRWVGWVCYLLEALDDQIDEAEYVAFLESLRGDITVRLLEGLW